MGLVQLAVKVAHYLSVREGPQRLAPSGHTFPSLSVGTVPKPHSATRLSSKPILISVLTVSPYLFSFSLFQHEQCALAICVEGNCVHCDLFLRQLSCTFCSGVLLCICFTFFKVL